MLFIIKRRIRRFALVFSKIWQFDKRLLFLLFVEIVIASLSPFPYIVFSRFIFDEMVSGVNYRLVLVYIVLMFSINYLLTSIGYLIGNINENLAARMSNHLKNDIYVKCAKLDNELFNDAATQDRISTAHDIAANNNFFETMQLAKMFFSNTVIVIGIIAILGSVDLWLLSIAILSIIVQCILYFVKTKKSIKLDMDNFMLSRRTVYSSQLATDIKYKKDSVVYKMSDYILNKIKRHQEEMFRNTCNINRMNYFSDWASFTLSVIVQIVSYIFLGLRVFRGYTTLGDFVMVINALVNFVKSASTAVNSVFELNKRTDYVSMYSAFLKTRNKFRANTCISINDINMDNIVIEFENVSFKYPESTSYVLRNINIRIDSREKLAIVGENGAGKTTFVMLLTRMYDPTDGCIRLNGVDIKKIHYDDYMSIFSTIFQDFQLTAFSILENISISEKTTIDEKAKILELLTENGLGAKIEAMYRGLDTPVSKVLGNSGMDFSGGERQRIAIVRALFKDAPEVGMDEPTSAIDPNAESDLYHKFAEITKSKTAVYISHRIASTRFCDKIAVFENGEIVEYGTFDELLRKQGVYYAFFSKQAQFFEH